MIPLPNLQVYTLKRQEWKPRRRKAAIPLIKEWGGPIK